MQIVGKVRNGRYDAVRKTVVESIRDTTRAPVPVEIKPVFPGLDSGRRAGLFTLELPDDLPQQVVKSLIESMRRDDAIEYADIAAEKRPL